MLRDRAWNLHVVAYMGAALTLAGCDNRSVTSPSATASESRIAGDPAPSGARGRCDCWSSKAPMLTARYGLGVAAIDGVLYAVGGSRIGVPGGRLAIVEAYDPATDTWTTKASMPTARFGLGVAAIDGVLYAVGGVSNTDDLLATVEAYDPATDTWTTKAPMPTGRLYLASGAISPNLYAVGGIKGETAATVEAYRP